MLSRYLLLGVLIGCSHLTYGGTVVTANLSCQIIDNTTGNVVFNDSHGLTITDPSTNFFDQHAVGLFCTSPYGRVGLGSLEIASRILLGSQSSPESVAVGLEENLFFQSFGPQFEVSALGDIHISQQQTFIATGASGIGFLTGHYSAASDDSIFGVFATLPNQFVTTPFGSCNKCTIVDPPVNFSYQFTFGQPFTLDVEGELTINLGPTVSQFDRIIAAGVGVTANVFGVVDANGNPIPGATFVAIPETGTGLLALAGILLVLLHSTFTPLRGVLRAKWRKLLNSLDLMYGGTLVIANISCQIIDRTTGNVVFNDSHGLTIADPSTVFDQRVSLGCASPYGSVGTAFSEISAQNFLALQGGNSRPAWHRV
jgi:hypothetical protein